MDPIFYYIHQSRREFAEFVNYFASTCDLWLDLVTVVGLGTIVTSLGKFLNSISIPIWRYSSNSVSDTVKLRLELKNLVATEVKRTNAEIRAEFLAGRLGPRSTRGSFTPYKVKYKFTSTLINQELL